MTSLAQPGSAQLGALGGGAFWDLYAEVLHFLSSANCWLESLNVDIDTEMNIHCSLGLLVLMPYVESSYLYQMKVYTSCLNIKGCDACRQRSSLMLAYFY